jgi:predicted Zn-dependent protease
MTLTRWYRGCTMASMLGVKVRRFGGAQTLVVAVTVLTTVLTAACATNPVTGKRQMSLLSEAEEAAIGQQQDAEIRREMGVYDDRALQQYVTEIGEQIARTSHRPNLPWTFTIVDSPAINAFALPGGYIYVTRGILAYLDDEAELAGVLGHEIGHVTARHAAQAYTRQAQANLGLTILSIFVPSTRPFADLGASGLGVLFLRNGREAEIEADRAPATTPPACRDFSPPWLASARSASAAFPIGCRRIPIRDPA